MTIEQVFNVAFKCLRCNEVFEAKNEHAAKLLKAGYSAYCKRCLHVDLDYASMPYRDYLKTDRWEGKALECYSRFEHRCAICNSPGSLEAHHRTYERRGDELPGDLTALCESCHALFTAYQRGLIEVPELD